MKTEGIQRILFSLLLMLIPMLAMGHSNSSSTHYTVVDAVISSGGGRSTSGNYTLLSSIGQNAQGTLSSSNYRLRSGFLPQVPQVSNRPPVIQSVGSRTVPAGTQITITLEATDPDGDALEYSASNPEP
jgi:hypothetical protein